MRPDFVTSFNDYVHIEKMSKDVKNSISKKKYKSLIKMIQNN